MPLILRHFPSARTVLLLGLSQQTEEKDLVDLTCPYVAPAVRNASDISSVGHTTSLLHRWEMGWGWAKSSLDLDSTDPPLSFW